MKNRKLISFDWAIKRLLRSKTNFIILEGFLSVLLNEQVDIIDIIDSESNKFSKDDKSNRVDIKVKDSSGRIVIIEVQFTREHDYLNRMLYGASKVITEHMYEGNSFKDVVKVVSVNIVFMSVGHGDDYVYHGTTEFRGIHTKDILELSDKERMVLEAETIQECYPEYFIIDVSKFDDLAKNSLDQWIYFLKNEEIKDEFDAPGLQAARKAFSIIKLNDEDRKDYENFIHFRRREFSRFTSSRLDGQVDGHAEGLAEGHAEGLAEGHAEGLQDGIKQQQIKTAKIAKTSGVEISLIMAMTGLNEDEIKQL